MVTRDTDSSRRAAMPKTPPADVRIIRQIGEGAHGEVYEGELDGQRVAVKLIRRSVGDTSFTIEQAKALQRVESDYVVQVLSIVKIKDPNSGDLVHGIVMEWIEGSQLRHVLRRRIELDEARRIGFGVIKGLRAIHRAELVHSDLHAGNVMIGKDHVKIIDVLYYDTLAQHSSESKERRYQRDRNDLRRILSEVLANANIGMEKVDAFSRGLNQESTLKEIRDRFDTTTDPDSQVDVGEKLNEVLDALRDKAFVDTKEYADAMYSDLDQQIARPLVEAMIANGIAATTHKPFLKQVWEGLSEDDRAVVGIQLGAAINREVPDGNWLPHLIMLQAFGVEGWKSLKRTVRLRLESAIASDILKGKYDAHSSFPSRAGMLGLFARTFYRRFTNPEKVIENIVVQLRPDWYSQNYIGMYFIPFIAKIELSAADRTK